jgi:hypothetical protein
MLLDLGSTMKELHREVRAERADGTPGRQREETRDPKAAEEVDLPGRRPDPQDPPSSPGSTEHAGPEPLEPQVKPRFE